MSRQVLAAIYDWSELAAYAHGELTGDDRAVNMAAVPFLMYSGYVISAWLLLRAAQADRGVMSGVRRRESLRFYLDHILPRTTALAASIRAGAPQKFTELLAMEG